MRMLIMMLCDRNDYDILWPKERSVCAAGIVSVIMITLSLFTPIETDQKDQKEMKHGVV